MKQGWEIKKLSQLFDVKSSKRVHQSDWKSSGIPFYRAREVVKLARDGNVSNELFISQELYDEFTKEKGAPKSGDIIVSAVGTLGLCYLVKDSDKFYFKDASVLWFDNLGKVNSRYIEYAFMSDSIMAQVMDGSMGATVGTLTISRAKDIKIPVPPLPEQQRIVSILDEAFTAIDKAKANAEQNLKNAKELFESFLQGVFENKGEGWEEKCFDEVCEISSKLIDPKLKEFQNLIHIGAGNIESKKGTLVDLKTAKEENLISGKFLFDETMVLYSKIRPYLVKVVKCDFNGLCSADIYPLVPFKNIMIKEFLYYLLISQNFTEYAIKGSQRAGMPKVNRNHLFAYTFNLPPLKEQQTIVQKLDALSTDTKKLETIYQQKIEDLEELKKSILQKAFSGEIETSI